MTATSLEATNQPYALITDIYGDDRNNDLQGDAGDNRLWGFGGNDILYGGGGLDTFIGGTGDDLYRVLNATDVIIENAGEGYDGVHSGAVTYTLPANVEWGGLLSSRCESLTGNALANTLTGYGGYGSLYGVEGDDILQNGRFMYGGVGDDSYYINSNDQRIIENSGEGYDTVYILNSSYDLPDQTQNIEKFIIAVESQNSSFTGNAYDSLIYGNTGNNWINGGGGADIMFGGAGNDTYYIDNVGDVVTEYADEGVDTVHTPFSYTMVNIEYLYLTGVNNIDGIGNDGWNYISGNSGSNSLYGYDGDDFLHGGEGSDLLIGGTGNDHYVVDNVNDVVVERDGEGRDIVQSFINYTLGNNLEDLTLAFAANVGIGNNLDNSIIGNIDRSDTLYGLDGNDTLDGGNRGEIDTLIGGLGDDIYYVDTVGDIVIELQNEGNDTVYSIRSDYSLAGTHVETLYLNGIRNINGTGNDLDNMIFGNNGNNILIGAGGSDYLRGNEGDDILFGGTGSNLMAGGVGNDDYHVSSLTDTLFELANQGYDRVSASVDHVLQANFEELTLFGTANLKGVGTTQSNRITGNSGDNALYGGDGNDILEGGAGTNLLVGGTGNDTYYVSSLTDTLFEVANQGYDRVVASVDHVMQANFEELLLIGTGNLKGVGNAQDNRIIGTNGDNALYGGDGNDILEGGTGTNLMVGGIGDDSYYVSSLTDTLFEAANQGYDRVFASVDHALQANFEELTLTGTANSKGVGNASSNHIQGNGGDNRLYGGEGDDTLSGEAGNDSIYGGAGTDTIRDGLGNDVVYGGSGADLYLMTGTNDGYDRFVFASIEEADGDIFGDVLTGEGYFHTGKGDVIDLSAIDASTLTPGNDAFAFLGYAAFTGQAGELILKVSDSSVPSFMVMGDVDGDGLQDFTITIAGSSNLVVSDFIL